MCVAAGTHHRELSILPALELNLDGRFRASRALSRAVFAGPRTAVTRLAGRPLKMYRPFIHETGLSEREKGAGVVLVVVVPRCSRLLREYRPVGLPLDGKCTLKKGFFTGGLLT